MELEDLNARILAVIAFCIVLVIGFVVSGILVVGVGFYYDVYTVFGQGRNAGLGSECLLGFMFVILALLAASAAYVCAKKTYWAVLKYGLDQDIDKHRP